jgi:hypothetical protein
LWQFAVLKKQLAFALVTSILANRMGVLFTETRSVAVCSALAAEIRKNAGKTESHNS